MVHPRITDVRAFVEARIVRGRVSLPAASGQRRGLVASLSQARKHATHYLDKRDDDALQPEADRFRVLLDRRSRTSA